MSYQSKYLKYKQKYLYLKNQIAGSSSGGSRAQAEDPFVQAIIKATGQGIDVLPNFIERKERFTNNIRPDSGPDSVMRRTICSITANTSFVTCFPTKFPFPSSENVALFTLLERNVTKERLLGLFSMSIHTIISQLEQMDGRYCSAGLQELNNTQEVYDLVERMSNNNYHFFMSNIKETYSGTYPSLGFIIKKNGIDANERFMSINDKRKDNRLSVNDKTLGEIKIQPDKPEMCYTLVDGVGWEKSGKFVGIRDLGVSHPFLKKGTINPDSGRPIACIVEKSTRTIHINAHVPNPSALTDITEGVNTLVVIQDPSSNSWKIWLEYCIENIQKCVNDILINDFGFGENDKLLDINFLFNGDCNDPKGYLRQYLQDTGIQILGKKVKFNFGDKILYTACPNTNSTNARKHDGSQLLVSSPAFTKAFSFLEDQSKQSPDDIAILRNNYLAPSMANEQNIMYPANYAFSGDYVGCSLPNTVLQQIDSSQSSDHQFVAASFLEEVSQSSGHSKRSKN